MATDLHREPWNKGIIVGQKAPLELREVWAIRMRLQLAHRARELALFNLGVDSQLRACDLVQLRVRDICHGDRVANRAIVMQQKTHRPVQFEITEPTREALAAWIRHQRCFRIWNSLHQENESIADLQTNKESSSCPAAVRSYKARKHGPLSRYRSGRRAGNGRAD
jgi:hypothetical protein